MSKINYIVLLSFLLALASCRPKPGRDSSSQLSDVFAKEMVEFIAYKHNPIFGGTNTNTWDQHIRERGYILYEDGVYKMWYTGYVGGDNDPKSLGFATSSDGINWTRYPGNPIFSKRWTEDEFVIKHDGRYYMYAEGKNDIAHLLISKNGIDWKDMGDLIILTNHGDTIPGPYGTPSVLIENGKWYLFYERNDEAIYLASSSNQITWKNIQDEPVLNRGPEAYDSAAVAANQIIKFKEKFYMYYHGSSSYTWPIPGTSPGWSSNVAMSIDLIHWTKYRKNPIVEGDHSSPILVPFENKFRLYTMHDQVWLYNPR